MDGGKEVEEFFALSTAKTTSKIAFLRTPAEAVEFWTEWPPFFGAEKAKQGQNQVILRYIRTGWGLGKQRWGIPALSDFTTRTIQ